MTRDHRPSPIDAYIGDLRRALARHGLSDEKMIDEVREHLVDAIAHAETEGLAEEEAARHAIERFGSAATVASACAKQGARVLERLLLVIALATGAAIAYIDSRPTWDDTGITAGALLLAGAALSYAAQRRAWVHAIALGVWIPMLTVVRHPDWRDVFMFLVLLVPLTGALIGLALRQLRRAV